MQSYLAAKDQYIIHKNSGISLGKVYDFVWDEKNGKLIAILLRKGLFHRKERILLPRDIEEWKDFIFVKNIQAVSLAKDFVRHENIFDEYYTFIAMPVYDENDVYVGKVIDYYFNQKLTILASLYIKGSKNVNHENLLVPLKDIISISEEKIIIKDCRKMISAFQPIKALT